MDGTTDILTNPPAFLKAYLYTTTTANVPFMEIDTSDLTDTGSYTFSLYVKVTANSGASSSTSTIGYTVVL